MAATEEQPAPVQFTTLTPFPNLYQEESRPTPCDSSTTDVLQYCGLSEQSLAIAWARLLNTYVNDEHVTFLSNQDITTVNTTSWSITRRQSCIDENLQILFSGLETAIVCTEHAESVEGLKQRSPRSCLTLQYDFHSGELRLHATNTVPKAHLPELGLQLRSALHTQVRNYEGVGDIFGTPPRLRLSLVNPYPHLQNGPRLLHELALDHKRHDATAIEFWEPHGGITQLTYRDFERRADALALRICSYNNVGPHSSNEISQIVPLLVPQSADLYVSLLAILKAGRAYCPLSIDTPQDRVKFILQDVAAQVVVTTKSLATRIPKLPGVSICLVDDHESNESVIEEDTKKTTFRVAQAEDAAYILYTSGSTGQPKGVQLSHLAVTQSLLAHHLIIPSFSRFLQLADPTFDISMFEIFFTFFRGATLVSCDKRKSLNDMAAAMNELKIDAADLTPTIAGSLVKYRKNVPHLKHLLTIGEMLTRHVVDEFGGSTNNPGILYNMYGPTEAAMHCTAMVKFPRSGKVGLIGTPLETVSAFITTLHDPKNPQKPMEILPVGQLGELVIGGHQLADGYLNRKEQTEAAFIDDNTYGRLYRTGDRARMLPDGSFECLGRLQSGLVKLYGQRIELGEIEQAALRTKGCRLAAASIVSNKIVLFYTSDTDDASHETIMKTCKAWLPPYMVPSDTMKLENMPRLVSGKIDRKGLEAMYKLHIQADATADENLTEAEKWVVDTISSIVGCKISLKADLFRQGLDSLSAIHIASKLRRNNAHFNSNALIVAEDVLQNPTCAQLTRFLSNNTSSEQPQNEFDYEGFSTARRTRLCKHFGIKESIVEAIHPTTSLQSGMISQFLRSQGNNYFNMIIVEFEKEYSDLIRLQAAWRGIVKEHAMLRTGFAVGDDAQYPFMMVTFKSDSADLPLVASDSLDTSHTGLQALRKRLASETMRTLHMPAWKLVLEASKDVVKVIIFAHHALYDAESLGMILHDVKSIYKRHTLTQRSSIQQALTSILTGNSSDVDGQHQAYWSQMLEGCSTTRFPDLAPLRKCDRAMRSVRLPCSASWKTIESSCRELAVTLQAALQVSWGRLLSKYLGEHDVCFGLIFSGRDNARTENAVFPCTSTVPYRCSVSEGTDIMLKHAMSFGASVRRHQHCTLTNIQRWAGLINTALFDTIMVFQRSDTGDGSDRSWTESYADVSVEYPFSLEIYLNDNEELSFQAVFWDDVVPDAQAQLLLEQFDCSVMEVLKVGSHGTSKLSPHLLSHIPAKVSQIPSNTHCLHGFVEEMAIKYPERIALEYNLLDRQQKVQTWSYAALNEEGNKAANLINDLGVKPRSIVATCFDKTPDAYFANLGVLKAASAFLAIDIGAPSARKKFILEDSNAALVLTEPKFLEALSSISPARVICIDAEMRSKYSAAQPESAQDVQPNDGCYHLYTSGSTGTPKGCELTHENAVQAMLAFQKLYADSWDEDSRWLQFASFHFDVSVMEQYWSWSVGICVVSTPRDILFEDFPGALHRLRITHIDLTPSLARLITPTEVPSLRKGVFVTGGEPLVQEVLDVWGPENVIHNGYGPTETTIGNLMYTKVPRNGKPMNIGWQFDNVGTYVFEPGTLNLVPRGAVGELCVSGKLVGKGYLNKPELTEKSFTFIEQYGERVYHTQDLVRMLHDGSFQFCGRVDDQVKLRGQRLELSEINIAIKSSSGDIEEVKTQVIKASNTQSSQLVAFASVKNTKSPVNGSYLAPSDDALIGKIKSTCQERLPGYMIPSFFILLLKIPLTGNNKHDNHKLKVIFDDYVSKNTANTASATLSTPLSTNETKIAKVLAQSLNIDVSSISSNSNIFQLGIDSISVFALSRKFRDTGFQNADPSILMKYQTIEGITNFLQSSKQQSNLPLIKAAKQNIAACRQKHRFTSARLLGIDPQDVEELAPCTAIQQGIIARSLESSGSLYFNTFEFDLASETDAAKLKKAWEIIYQRISSLRLRFVPIEDGYVQVIIKNKIIPWYDLSVHSGVVQSTDELKRSWISLNDEVFRQPLQIILQQNSPKASVKLILNIFHALYDAISLTYILDNLVLEYNGVTDHDIGPSYFDVLPYGPLQEIPHAERFWTQYLGQACFNAIPKNSAKEQIHDSYAVLELPVLENLESARRALGVTHQAIFQTCWSFVLYTYIGAPTIVGRVISGRSIGGSLGGADKVIGPMFNTIPYYIDTSNTSETWADAIQKCHSSNIESLPYHHTPLRDIIRWTKSGSSRSELFDTLFVFQKSNTSPSAQTQLWTEVGQSPVADYPLALEIDQREDSSLRLTILAERSTASEAQCLSLLEEFRKLLEFAVTKPSSKFEQSIDTINKATSQNSKTQSDISIPATVGGTRFEWSGTAERLRTKIAEIANVLENDITEYTSIFELGIDSIDCIKLSSRFKKEGLLLSVSTILKNPTIAQMLSKANTQIRESDSRKSDDQYTKLRQQLSKYYNNSDVANTIEVVDIFPPTPLQESMLAEMYSSNFETYFNHDVLRIYDKTDVDRLVAACHELVAKSPILRTSFLEIDDPSVECVYAQLVHENSPVKVRRVNLDSEEALNFFIAQINADAKSRREVFAPCQLTVVATPSSKFLVLSMAHAIYDGWSLNLLHTDICRAYNRRAFQRPEYDRVLQSIINGGSDIEADMFWKGYLSGLDTSKTLGRKTQSSSRSKVYLKESLSNIRLDQILQFCKHKNVTLQTLGVTCWSFVLASYSNQLDVAFGIVLAGRDDEEAQQVMFPTMNTLVARTIVHGTREEMLHYTQTNLANMRQFQYTSLRKIRSLAGYGANQNLDSLFIYQIQLNKAKDLDSLYESVKSESKVDYPVCVEMEIVQDALLWRIACKDTIFSEDETLALLDQLDNVLSSIFNDSQEPSLQFTEGGDVAVCGLAPFTPVDTSKETMATHIPSTVHMDEQSKEFKAVVHVVATIAKVEPSEVLPASTIFSFGLDSISAIKVSALLRKQGLKISVSEVMQASTIGAISKTVKSNRNEDINTSPGDSRHEINRFLHQTAVNHLLHDAGIDPSNVDDILPSTSGQIHLLSNWQNNKGALFLPIFSFHTQGLLSISDLRNAWERLVQHHSILRTTFVASNSQSVPLLQVVLKNGPKSSFTEQEASKISKFDFLSSPVSILAVEKDDRIIFNLKIHHALYDAVSLPLIMKDLGKLCNKFHLSDESQNIEFHDFIAVDIAATAFDERKQFWVEYLQGLTNTTYLSHRCVKDHATRTACYRQGAVKGMVNLDKLLRNSNISIQALFLAIFARTYAKTLSDELDSKESDLLIGMYLANRSRAIDGLEELRAPTVNMVPLRIKSPLLRSLIDAAKQIQRDLQLISSPVNSGVGLWEIEQWTGLRIDNFVNFIRLPESVEGDGNEDIVDEHVDIDKKIVIKESSEHFDLFSSFDRKESSRNFETPKPLMNNMVLSAYPDNMDIEAAIRGGSLDIGVFAAEELVSNEMADQIIGDIIREFKALM